MQTEPLKYLLHGAGSQLWWESHVCLGIPERAELSLPWLSRAFAAALVTELVTAFSIWHTEIPSSVLAP